MQTLLQDLRYAIRQLCKSPGFTIAAVLTLTFGIGANTAVFSSMDAVVLHPLTVPQLDRVVTVAEQGQREWSGYLQVSLANFEDWKRQSQSFEQLSVLTSGDRSITGGGEPARVRVASNSANFFSVLRVQPIFGRLFQESECQPGRDSVAVLNYGFWQRRFAGDPAVLGRKIELDQRVYTVIGVLPKTVQYPSEADIFLPFAPTPEQLSDRVDHSYLVNGRLRDGVTVRQAQAELRTIAERLAKSYPATNQGWTVRVEPLLDGINGPYTPMYYRLIMGATLFVLLVVCANVANLQFARGIARRQEIAMRSALGASRWRIMRQLLTENILLGMAGAAGGLAFGSIYLHIVLVTMPARVARYIPGWSNTALNGRAMGFSLLLAVGTGILSGLAPALEALRVNLIDQLKSGSRGSIGSGRTHRLRNIFAVAQISLAVALVIGAALISKGMDALLHSADVYNPNKVLTFKVKLPLSRYGTAEKQAAWFNSSLGRLRSLPGVTHADTTAALPYSDSGWVQDCAIENRPTMPGKFQSAMRITVDKGYFDAFKIPILSGRSFTQNDAVGTLPVAVVSTRFVDRYFPNQNPTGHRIRMGGESAAQTPWLTIVGVAQETNYTMWDESMQPAVYLSSAQIPNLEATFALMTDGDPMALAVPARRALAGLDPALPLDGVQTWQQGLHEQLTGLIYAAAMMGIDALIALLLAAIGIFAVMANQVGERTREIGVRLAMGARRQDVLGMILGRAGLLTGTGVCIGLVMAFALAHGVANLLRGVRPDDPVVFTGITATIALIAIGASWIPARRASRIEPMEALRDE
jgi:putative ABC transport system permease protein